MVSKWNYNKYLAFNLNYTYTSTYDGAEQDDPNNSGSQYNAQMVRVPRHLLNLNTEFQFAKLPKFDFALNTKWSDEARDYGNGNEVIAYNDNRLDDYLVNDLFIKYDNKLFFNITNLFDERYETARDYNQIGRSFNIGFKQEF